MDIQWKNIAVVAMVVLLIGAIAAYKFGVFDRFTSDNTNTVTNSSSSTYSNSEQPVQRSSDGSVNVTPAQNVQAVDNSSSVGIVAPPEPNGGKVKRISMIGPSGVYNSLVQSDGRSYKLIRKGFTPMLINEKAVSIDDIKKAINQYIGDSWKGNPRVSSNGDIQVVIASSLTGNEKIKTIMPDLKKTYVVTETTSDLEGAGAFRVAVNPQYQNTATVMDITPTITRLTYSSGSGTRTVVAKTGSKYFQNGQTDAQALNEIRNAMLSIPPANRQLIIVLWSAAEKDLRQGANRYSGIPNYNGDDPATQSGLRLINEVKSATNANVVLDFESMWFSSF